MFALISIKSNKNQVTCTVAAQMQFRLHLINLRLNHIYIHKDPVTRLKC